MCSTPTPCTIRNTIAEYLQEMHKFGIARHLIRACGIIQWLSRPKVVCSSLCTHQATETLKESPMSPSGFADIVTRQSSARVLEGTRYAMEPLSPSCMLCHFAFSLPPISCHALGRCMLDNDFIMPHMHMQEYPSIAIPLHIVLAYPGLPCQIPHFLLVHQCVNNDCPLMLHGHVSSLAMTMLLSIIEVSGHHVEASRISSSSAGSCFTVFHSTKGPVSSCMEIVRNHWEESVRLQIFAQLTSMASA